MDPILEAEESGDSQFTVKLAKSSEDFDFIVTMVREEQRKSAGIHCMFHLGSTVEPGFFIGYIDGLRIGHVCAIKHDIQGEIMCFYRISWYLVDKAFQGKGYGRKIWNAMWKSLPKGCNIVLDSVLDKVPMYEKMGLRQEWLNKQYVISCSRVIELYRETLQQQAKINVKPLTDISFDQLAEYDASVYGFAQHEFLKKWITIPESLGWVAINEAIYMADNTVIGYVVIQQSVMEKHQMVGPLFSDNTHIAQVLLYTAAEAATKKMGNDKLVLWTPVGVNPKSADMIENEIGYESVVELMLMSNRGLPPQFCMQKIVAVTSAGFSIL